MGVFSTKNQIVYRLSLVNCSGIAENDDTPIATDVEGPGTLEFDFELEGDSDGNTLTYSVDGVIIKSITTISTKPITPMDSVDIVVNLHN